MFDHFEYSVADIEATRRFYGPVCLAVVVRKIFFDEETKSAGFGPDGMVRLLLTGDHRAHKKPEPAPYRTALSR